LLAQLEDEVRVLQQHHLHAAQLLAHAKVVGRHDNPTRGGA
jgi:hypothetical protein